MPEIELVTVVVTTHKRAPKMVERAILSVTGQTYKNWELIVVDDSPKEYDMRGEVKKLVQSIIPPDRLSFIQNESCRGACYSRNIGLAKAKGEYIAYLDDDDEWLPEKLEKQLMALRIHPNAALVYGPFFRVSETSHNHELIQMRDVSDMQFRDILYQGNCFGGMSMPLLRTCCVVDVGGFDESMQSSQDTDLWLRLFTRYEVAFIDSPLVNYYVHEGEQIGSNPLKKIDGIERINEKYREYLENDAELWWKRNSILILFYEKSHMGREALLIWWRCVRKCPWKVYDNMRNLLILIKHKIIRS